MNAVDKLDRSLRPLHKRVAKNVVQCGHNI